MCLLYPVTAIAIAIKSRNGKYKTWNLDEIIRRFIGDKLLFAHYTLNYRVSVIGKNGGDSKISF